MLEVLEQREERITGGEGEHAVGELAPFGGERAPQEQPEQLSGR